MKKKNSRSKRKKRGGEGKEENWKWKSERYSINSIKLDDGNVLYKPHLNTFKKESRRISGPESSPVIIPVNICRVSRSGLVVLSNFAGSSVLNRHHRHRQLIRSRSDLG